MSIRWRLIFSLAVPLLLVLGVMAVVDFIGMRANALADMRRDLRGQAVSFADRLDTRFESVEQLADTAAELLQARGLQREQILAVLRTNLTQNKFVAATRIALAPGAARGPEGAAVQLRRGRDELIVEPIRGDFRSMPWYAQAAPRNAGFWLEAQPDPLLDNEPVATYVVPLIVEKRFVGVVALVVRLSEIQDLLTWGRGQIEQFAVVDRQERFVSHPDPAKLLDDEMRKRLDKYMPDHRQKLSAATMDEPLIVPVWIDESTGKRTPFKQQIIDAVTGKNSYWFAFAPIKSTDWLFVTMMPESSVMPELMRGAYRRTAFALIMLFVLLFLISMVSIKIVRPIERVSKAVDEVAKGNFDVEVRAGRKNARDEVSRLANGFNTMVTQIKKQIRALTRETSARERVESELRVARDIQTSLLPQSFPPFPEHREFSLHAINLPAKQVAGDFFDFFFTDDGKLIIVIADVSGKGVPAAMLMAVTRTLIRNRATMGATPSQIVEHTNDLLYADNQGSMFVTMFVCAYELATGELTYVNAGHPQPYVCSEGHEPRLFGEVTAPLVGACETGPMGPFDQAQGRLEPGETLLMFTDGVIEARSPDDKMLRDEGFLKLLKSHRSGQVDELCQFVADEVDRFQAGSPVDDVTIVALRRNR